MATADEEAAAGTEPDHLCEGWRGVKDWWLRAGSSGGRACSSCRRPDASGPPAVGIRVVWWFAIRSVRFAQLRPVRVLSAPGVLSMPP